MDRIANRLGLNPLAVLGLVMLVGGTLVWVLTFTNTLPKLFAGGSTTKVRADFGTAEDVVPNDPVRIDGVQVGTVSGVSVDPGGRGATVSMDINNSAGALYRNSSAAIQWRTVLGANDAISLDPGTHGAGPLGSSVIPQSQTSDQVELDEITRTLHDGAQTGLQTMFKQLGPAFSNHLAPEQTFGTLAQVAPTAATGIGALRGVQTDTDLKNLVVQASRAAQALDVGPQASYTKQFVQSAASTLAITGAEQANIRATIADAEILVPHLTKTTAAVDHALYLLDPLVATLSPVAPTVAPTLADLHPALLHLNVLLNDAKPLLHSLRPTVKSLASTASTGVPVIDALSPALRRVDAQILPALDKVSPETKHTVYEMIGPLFQGFGDISGGYDQNGYLARLTGSVSENVLDAGVPCRLNFAPGAQLLTCQTVLQILDSYLTPPGSSARRSAVVPALATLEQKYPAIAAHLLRNVPSLLGGVK